MSIFSFIAGLFMDDTHQQNVQMMQDMQMVEDMLQQELIRQMNDPFVTPGLDAGIDEAHHGIDHGMGIANPEHIFEHTDESFFGGLADSFFGSSDDSLFRGSDDSFFGGGFGGDDFF